EKHSIEFCGKYFYSRGNGEDFVREEISFRPTNSHRVRLGGRLAYPYHWKLAPWCGAFYEREFAGTARGSAGGLEIPQPSLKGGSTAGELGLSYRPSAAAAIDLALHGSAGRQKSVSGSLRARYEF
ncbi:MAG: autotransporter domain-containing protein, partial [Puniceicoccales bacterium]|nr:autotransporter domain-containing protein [Puniceicoccales bacterium]